MTGKKDVSVTIKIEIDIYFLYYLERRFFFKGVWTRYIESGCYDGFFKRSGRKLLEKKLNTQVNPYKVYCYEDFANCKRGSKF